MSTNCIQQLPGFESGEDNVSNVKRYRPSKKTVVRCTRLSHEIDTILLRRARYHPYGIAGYMRDWLTFELKRNHHRGKGKNAAKTL